MYRKWLILAGYAAIAVYLFTIKENLIGWLQDGGSNPLYLTFAVVTLLAIVPVIPFGVTGGIIGLKYGVVVGGLLNVASSATAAALFFLLVRIVFRERARKWLSNFKSIDRFTSLFENNAFMAVMIARLIPVLPAPAVNGYAAVSSMTFTSYLIATLIGKIPVMFVFAWIGDQLFVDLEKTLMVAGVYSGFVLIVYWMYRKYLTSV